MSDCTIDYEVLTAGEKPRLWVHGFWSAHGSPNGYVHPGRPEHPDAIRFEGEETDFYVYLAAKYGEFDPPLEN